MARIDTADPARTPPKPDIRSMLRPLGPVAVFGASNFPLAFSVAGGDTASALAAGNPVVVKAHPAHPGTSELVGRIVQSAVQASGLPAGVFSLLFDGGYEVGAALVQHPGIRAVGFTGSLRGGRALMDLAAARPDPIPVYAEMGSTNPVFILPGALQERGEQIAEGLHGSFTLGGGQMCTKPGVVFAGSEHSSAIHRAPQNSDTGWAGLLAPHRRHRLELQARGRPPRVSANRRRCSRGRWLLRAANPARDHRRSILLRPIACGGGLRPNYAPGALPARPSRCFVPPMSSRAISPRPSSGPSRTWQQNHELLRVLESKVGRLIFNGFPTGVEVCHAMVHGGPYPATSDGRSTSVGSQAIFRFARPVAYQGLPQSALHPALQDANPLGILRLWNGAWSSEAKN